MIMKPIAHRLLPLALAIASCLSPLACFGQYSVNTGIQTNRVVTAGATSNYTSSITIARTRYVAARVSLTTTNTGASGNFYTLWQTSLDNTNWNDAFVITNTVSGTNIVSAQTNQFDIGSHQYLKMARATNNATHQVTNLYAIVTYKVSVAQDVISAIGYDVQPASTTLSNVSNGDGTLVVGSWTNLVNIPSGFNDGTDDIGPFNFNTNTVSLILTNIHTTPTNTSTPFKWQTLSTGGATPVYF